MSLAAASAFGLKAGTPAMKSVGPLAVGPEGILFVADNVGAMVYALDVGPGRPAPHPRPLNIEGLDTRLAAYLGCSRLDVAIKDMAVRPGTEQVFLSVMRGTGASAVPVILTLDGETGLSELSLESIPFARTPIDDAPEESDQRLEVRIVLGDREGEEVTMRNGGRIRIARDRLRTVTVTDMAFVGGDLLVAGASNEEFSSTLRRIPFPFQGPAQRSTLEIFHVSHGKYETASPIRTFVPYGQASAVLASYTCTPVVHFPLRDLRAGAKVKGRTVAELGAGNTPLDMVSYSRNGQEYLLISNSRHPLMKIAAKDIDGQGPLTQPREPLGVPRQELPQKGVSRMANLNGSYVLMMQLDSKGNTHLRSYETASL